MPNALRSLIGSFDQSYNRSAGQFQQDQREKEREQDTLDREMQLTNYKNELANKEEVEHSKNAELALKGQLNPVELHPKAFAKYKVMKASQDKEEAYDKIGKMFDSPEAKNLPPEDVQRMKSTIEINKLLGTNPASVHKEIEDVMYPKVKSVEHRPYSQVITYDNGRQEVKPTEGLNPSYKPNWKENDIPGGVHKDKFGRALKDVGYYDPNADIYKMDTDGNYHVVKSVPIKINGTGTNGEKIFHQEIQQHLKSYTDGIKSINNALEVGVDANNIPLTKDEIDALNRRKDQIGLHLNNVVKNTAPPSFMKWYKAEWDHGIKKDADGKIIKKGGFPGPEQYGKDLVDAVENRVISLKAAHSGTYLYWSHYKKDPFTSKWFKSLHDLGYVETDENTPIEDASGGDLSQTGDE